MRYRLWLILLVLGSLFGTLVPGLAVPVAAQNTGIELAAGAAFSGMYRPGAWLPVYADLRNEGVDRRVEVRVGADGGPQYAVQVDLPGGGQKQVTLYVYLPAIVASLDVFVLDGSRELAFAKVDVDAARGREQLVGLLSASGSAPTLPPRLPNSSPLTVVPLSGADLPDNALGLSSFSSLLLDDLATADLRPSQLAALEGWVLRGGRLLIGGGPGAERTLSGLPESLRPAAIGAQRLLPAATLIGAGAADLPDLP
ncbi:MAG: hypothetical protein HC822_27545 [Oscillochloris sp.]|nr:hypothetical protein [Oscillochloris sp.]